MPQGAASFSARLKFFTNIILVVYLKILRKSSLSPYISRQLKIKVREGCYS
jgi:hypothetical protein